MVGGEREVINRWAQYFRELLNKTNPEITGIGNDECYVPQNPVQKPTPSMIYDIIMKLKDNRVPGEDGILAKLLKQGGIVLWRRIYQITVSVWEKEEMPADWQMAIICSVYKKGDKLSFSNYRRISLLNAVYKIFTNTLA
jgi:hypothetical protein